MWQENQAAFQQNQNRAHWGGTPGHPPEQGQLTAR